MPKKIRVQLWKPPPHPRNKHIIERFGAADEKSAQQAQNWKAAALSSVRS